MAEPKVSILLTLVDKMTAPVEGARSAIGKFGASIKGLGTEAMDLLNNKLIQGIGFAGIVAGLGKSFDAADAFRVALQKLEGTAKITGIPIEYLTGIAEQATEQFKLSKTQAADFAVEMAKLASKAGDVGKAGPALQAFLDIGAARGLSAGETLKAVQQAILGIDEGTDKLFNANPSVLYKQFADAIGTTAAKLTDQQKAQALLTAAMTDGSKVMGTYQDYLASTAGQLEIAKNKTESAYATMGVALNDLRQSMASAIGFLAEKFTQFIGGIQILGADAALAILGVPARFKLAWGELVQAIANTMGESRILMTIFGDGLTDIAKKMGASGDRMVTESRKNLRDLKAGHDEVVAGIVNVVGAGERKQTGLVKSGGANRVAAVEGEGREKTAAMKRFELEQEAIRAKFAGSFEEFVRRRRDLEAEAARVTRLVWGDTYKEIGEKVGKVFTVSNAVQRAAFQTIIDGMDGVYDGAQKIPPKVKVIGDETFNAARGAISLANEFGTIDDQTASVLNNVVNLADSLKNGLAGISAGNLVGAVGALAGIMGGIFGEGPQTAARRALFEKNNQRLQELKDRMGELLNISTPLGKVSAFQGLNSEQLIMQNLDRSSVTQFGKNVSVSSLSRSLASQGLSVTDLRQLAGEFGIDLGEKNGNIDAAALRQLFTAMSGQTVSGFGGGVAGDLSRLDFLNNANGGGSLGTLQGLAAILSRAGVSDAFGSIFSGVNLGDGVDAGEGSLLTGRTRGVASGFADGSLGATSFAGLSNAQVMSLIPQLLQLLQDIAGATASTATAVTSGGIGTVSDTDMATSFDLSTAAVGG